MNAPLFRVKGLNGFIKATRKLAAITGRSGLEFGPHWIDRLVVATASRRWWREAWAQGRARPGRTRRRPRRQPLQLKTGHTADRL